MESFQMSSNGKLPDELRTFTFHGVDLSSEPNSSQEIITDCPFCDKDKHFYISAKEDNIGQFSCKSCGVSGNRYTFLQLLHSQYLQSTTTNRYSSLAKLRHKLPKENFIEAELAWDSSLSRWLIPLRSATGSMVNIVAWNPKEKPKPVPYSTSGCKLHLFGMDSLKEDGPIYICEGPWDRIALLHLLAKAKVKEPPTVLAVPGASNLPESSLKAIGEGREYILLYDNDKPGKEGMVSATKKLYEKASALRVSCIQWPDSYPEGFDISDLVASKPGKPKTTWETINSWLEEMPSPSKKSSLPELTRSKFSEIVSDFESTGISMDSRMIDGLAICLAIAHSGPIPGEPVWAFLVGPPSSGKSLLLESLIGSPGCLYQTAIHSRSLCSGFKTDDGEDPSLLAILPGKSLVIKDYTTILSMSHQEQKELLGLLREVYDGQVDRTYGNQIRRVYPPPDSDLDNCYFAIVAGVTNEIHVHSEAALGPRFLKYQLRHSSRGSRDSIFASMEDAENSEESMLRKQFRQASVRSFLSRQLRYPNPTIPNWYKRRLASLVEFISICRAEITRSRDSDLYYEPSPEGGGRLARQLIKLSKALCMVFNKKQADKAIYRLICRVAIDTSHGWKRDIFLHLAKNPKSEKDPMTSSLGFSIGTLYRTLRDLQALGAATYTTKGTTKRGQPKQLWSLSDWGKKLYTESDLANSFIPEKTSKAPKKTKTKRLKLSRLKG